MARLFLVVLYLSFFGGAVGVLAKISLAAFTPIQLIFLRLLATSLFFAFIFWRRGVLLDTLRLVAEKWRVFMLLVVSGIGGGMIIGFYGLKFTSAINYGILFNLSAVFMAAFAVIFLAERLRWQDGILLAVALVGAGLIVTNGHFSLDFFHSQTWGGDFLVILAAAGWGFYSIFGSYVSRCRAEITPSVIVFGSCLVGVAVLLPYVIFVEPLAWASFMSGRILIAAIALAFLATAGLFYLWFEFINKRGGVAASFVVLSENVGGAILPILFLGERLTWPVALGGILIIGALAWRESWRG